MHVNSIFIMSSNEMGQFESGVAAKFFGVVRSEFRGTMTIYCSFCWKIYCKIEKMEY